MSFRLRVTLAAAAAALMVMLATSTAVYLLVRQDLREQVDESLLRGRPPGSFDLDRRLPGANPPQSPTGVDQLFSGDRFLQVIDRQGQIVASYTDGVLPTPDEVLDLATRGPGADMFYDSSVDGVPVRVYAVVTDDGLILQFGRSLTELNDTLGQLLLALVAITGIGLGLAVLLGRLVAAAAVSPVHRLSAAAETIARTGDLSHRIEVSGSDELARLADSFNTMLDALDTSLGQQRHLVADASHELRTPLASVRTNVEVLQRSHHLDPVERSQLLQDIVAQIGELTRLVEDLVELARGEDDEETFDTLDLADVAAQVVERARRNHPRLDFRMTTSPSPSWVVGARRRVERAITNLVDNAAKWSPTAGQVRIDVVGPAVAVTDQGPGIDPEDVPRLFDRFYRSDRARSMPGSGLGLAIVKQVVDSHRGAVSIEEAPEGGARFVLRLRRPG